MFTSKVLTDDSRLLDESKLAARQPRRAPHDVIQTITSEGLAQGPYVAASGFEPATFRTEGTEHHQLATRPSILIMSNTQSTGRWRLKDQLNIQRSLLVGIHVRPLLDRYI